MTFMCSRGGLRIAPFHVWSYEVICPLYARELSYSNRKIWWVEERMDPRDKTANSYPVDEAAAEREDMGLGDDGEWLNPGDENGDDLPYEPD